MRNFKPGLVSVSFRNLPPQEILNLMKQNDLEYVEWGSDVHASPHDTDNLEYIAGMQKDMGIKCSSYGTYFRICVNETEEIYDYIKAAKILGTNVLRLWCSDKSASKFTDEEKENLFLQCRKLADIAEKENVILCMECHINTFTDNIESALELMERVSSPNFRMYYQPNQYKTEEQNLIYASRIADYTVNIHVFNWKEKEKYPLDPAKNIWSKYLMNFDGDKFLLLEFMPDGKEETLTQEANTLREIIGGLI